MRTLLPSPEVVWTHIEYQADCENPPNLFCMVNLRARAIVAVATFLTWFVLILLAVIGVRAWWYDLTAFIGHAADSVVRLRVLKLKGDDTVVNDPRWPLFALKLIMH